MKEIRVFIAGSKMLQVERDAIRASLMELSNKNIDKGVLIRTYTFEDLTGFIQTIYQYLADKVSNGHISLTPTEDACLFCDHFSICRFHSLKGKTNVPEGLTSHFFKEVK